MTSICAASYAQPHMRTLGCLPAISRRQACWYALGYIRQTIMTTSAEATAGLLIEGVFRLYGLPDSIVLDRGPQFVADVWKSFCRRLGINSKLSTVFHPEIDS